MSISPYIYAGLLNNHVINNLDNILSRVCQATGVCRDEIISKTRKKEVIAAKQAYCYYARKNTGYSFKKIGSLLAKNYDHASVIHSVNKYANLLQVKDAYIIDLDKNIKKYM